MTFRTLLSRNIARFVVGAVLAAATVAPLAALAGAAPRSDAYRAGQRALSEERWQDALNTFSALADAKGENADAALYWKAWTESKLGRRADAMTTLRALSASYPKSEWLDDAKALELEIGGRQQAAGLVDSGDEDLKLYALDSLMQADPERAVPILERFLAGEHSLKLKERALFVLAQSDSPRARQILAEMVRSGSPPELRLKAVEQLGVAGHPEDLAALSAIWKDAAPPVKSKVLEAWMIAGQVQPVAEVARNEKDPGLRRKAIEMLGVMDAADELDALYAGENDPAVRAKLLEAYGIAGDVDALAKAAHQEKDPQIRGKAIEGLGVFGGERGAKELAALYATEKEPALRSRILQALMVNGDATTLIELFRGEKDPAMKRTILQQLSLMDDPAVDRLMSDLLEDKP